MSQPQKQLWIPLTILAIVLLSLFLLSGWTIQDLLSHPLTYSPTHPLTTLADVTRSH